MHLELDLAIGPTLSLKQNFTFLQKLVVQIYIYDYIYTHNLNRMFLCLIFTILILFYNKLDANIILSKLLKLF